jgi:hypothetical protein
MNGSLDNNFGENRSSYMAQVVGRNSRYPRNGVTMILPRQDAAGSKRPNFRSLTMTASDVTVDPILLVTSPPGRTRHKVSRSLGNVSRRVAFNPLTPCRNIQVTDMFPSPAINMGGLTSEV